MFSSVTGQSRQGNGPAGPDRPRPGTVRCMGTPRLGGLSSWNLTRQERASCITFFGPESGSGARRPLRRFAASVEALGAVLSMPLTALAALVLACLALAALPAASQAMQGRDLTSSFGVDGSPGSTFAGGLVDQLDFSHADDRLVVLVRGASDAVDAKIYAYNAPSHAPSGGAFPFTVAPPGRDPDISVDNTTGATAGNVYYLSTNSGAADRGVHGFDASGTALGGNFPVFLGGSRGLAVDPAGDIWVGVASTTNDVMEFSALGVATGTSVRVVTPGSTGTTIANHVALDSHEDLYVAIYNGATWKYTAASGYTDAQLIDPDNTRAIRVDRTTDEVYVVHDSSVSVYDASGTLAYVFGDRVAGASYRGIAIDESTDTVYLADANTHASPGNNEIHVFSSAHTVDVPTATVSAPTNVGPTSATFHGTVTIPPPGFGTGYHFEYSSDGSHWTKVPTTDVRLTNSAAGDYDVTANVDGLVPNTNYAVRLVVSFGPSFFDTSTAVPFTTSQAPPQIVRTYSGDVGQHTAILGAHIRPQNLTTTYHIEWGPTSAYGSRSPSFERSIGGGRSIVIVQEAITALHANTSYHFRIVATNAAGTTTGPDHTVTTLNVAGLPGNRGYELVSPADKGPGNYVGTIPLTGTQFQGIPARNGQSVLYPLALGLPDSTAGGDLRYLATRDVGGWQSVQATPHSAGPPLLPGSSTGVGLYRYVSDDLSCRIMASNDRLSPDAPTAVLDAGGANLYRQNLDGSYTAINPPPVDPVPQGADTSYVVLGASDDCTHIVFETTVYRYPGVADTGVYAWDAGTVRNLAVLPDNSAGSNAHVGSDLPSLGGPTVRWGSVHNALSADGSRAFFTATSNDGNDVGKVALYVRESGSSTVKVSASETATANQGAVFQTASTDGSRVLFLANYGLTTHTSAGPTNTDCTAPAGPPAACDLYAFDVETGDLTDLSADTDDSGGARVAGVLGTSDDASYVYFAAQGRLVPDKGRTAEQNESDSTYNVYLHHAGDLRYVGQIGQEKVQHPAATMLTQRAGSLTSQVTPDGQHLLFASTVNFADYDSGGVNEAYLYDAGTGNTACVSCRRDGRQAIIPQGFDTARYSPLPKPNYYNMGYATTLQHVRAISDDGSKVFFTSADPLDAGAVSGEPNVYVWRDGQVSFLAVGPPGHLPDDNAWMFGTAFRGASASGDDAFFTTQERLVPQDVDDQIDLYDVRVGGGFPAPPVPLTPCDPLAGTCRGPTAAPPVLSDIGSVSFGGAGNVPLVPDRVRTSVAVSKLKAVSGPAAKLKVRVPDAGRISLAGSSIRRTSRSASKAGVYTVRIKLRPRAKRLLRKKKRLRVKARVSFRARGGRSASKTVKVTFKQPKRKRAKAKKGGW